MVEKAFGKRILCCAGFVAKDAGNETHHGVDKHQRGQSSVRQNVVANRNFVVD